MGWKVYWVPSGNAQGGVRRKVLTGWEDLAKREDEVGIKAGDPIFLSPEHRVEPVLAMYGQSRSFRSMTTESRRNYATDISLLLTFLWSRGRAWADATERDLEDFEHWRRVERTNPRRIGGTKWDRELAAFAHLYKWAAENRVVARSPVAMKQVLGRNGEVLTVPEARAKDARSSNVHWLTPRTWRRWIDVGLRGHTRGGLPASDWVGRVEDRNVACVRFMVSSGLRRSEAGSLLLFEIPQRRVAGGRYYRGVVGGGVTRAKKGRTFYVRSDAVGDVEVYVDSSRAMAVRRAQRRGVYDMLAEMLLVTEVTRGRKPMVHWRDRSGTTGVSALDELTVEARMSLFTEGPSGAEPLWLWLNERGLPLAVESWNGVFTEANRRCAQVLIPEHLGGVDPYAVHAPYATPHSTRHSFALYMLVVLNAVMDRRFGLTPEERRDFRLLYGDPWLMVQNLLGHASRQVTVDHYLAPVADLQLRSLLADADGPEGHGPLPDLDAVFARIASESEGIQDIDDRMRSGAGGVG